jgi:hypothetical protein
LELFYAVLYTRAEAKTIELFKVLQVVVIDMSGIMVICPIFRQQRCQLLPPPV